MTTSTLALLDQTELLQLATTASTAGDSGAAIGYLKEAVSRADASGIVHFMLGAEYAEIKLYDRAVAEMEAALALDPALSIARLQLGLLWLTGGVADRAETVLSPLAELPDSDALRHFGAGLCALMKDQFDETVLRLERGIALNTSNLPLNDNMQKILDEVKRLQSGTAAAEPVKQEEAAPAEDAQHVLLSAYTGNTSH